MRTIIPKDAKLLPKDAKKVFDGEIFEVYQWQQEMFDGSQATFEMLKRPDTVKVIAIKQDKLIVCEEQQPHTEVFFDVPSGRHDNPAETELDAAKRELLEETGMTFTNWKLIAAEQPYGKMEWFVYTFLATDFIEQIEQKLDAGEKITVLEKTLEEVLELADHPKNRYIPMDILSQVNSIDELKSLPSPNLNNID